MFRDLPEQAMVLVDRKKATVRWADDGGTAEITVVPGDHEVQVKKDGFTMSGQTVTVEKERGRCSPSSLNLFHLATEERRCRPCWLRGCQATSTTRQRTRRDDVLDASAGPRDQFQHRFDRSNGQQGREG